MPNPSKPEAKPAPIYGTCTDCGCTDYRACNPPCCWVNVEHTLCSRCWEKRNPGEFFPGR